MNLLGASRSKSLSTLVTRELIRFRMRMPMVHELSTVGELFVTNLALDTLVPMRWDVTFQAGLVVEGFRALWAWMVLFSWMFPRVFDERSLIATLFATQPTWWLGQLVLVVIHEMDFDVVFLVKHFTAQLTLEMLESSMSLCMSQKI